MNKEFNIINNNLNKILKNKFKINTKRYMNKNKRIK